MGYGRSAGPQLQFDGLEGFYTLSKDLFCHQASPLRERNPPRHCWGFYGLQFQLPFLVGRLVILFELLQTDVDIRHSRCGLL